MEWMIPTLTVVFLCLGCLYFGYRIGVKNREIRTVERVIENGKVVTHTEAETIQDPKPEKPKEGEVSPEKQMENWNNYKG
jgi:hypothetical protein